MKQIKQILAEMLAVATEIERLESLRLSAPDYGDLLDLSKVEISGMIQDAKQVIAGEIVKYRALSAQQSKLLREWEIKDCKKPDFSDVGNPHTPENYGHFNPEYRKLKKNAA